MISVQPNKNVILFSVIVKTLLKESSETPYAKEILKDFLSISDSLQGKEFLNKCDEKILSRSIFPYLRFAIYSDINLKPSEELHGYYSYGSKAYELYKETVSPLFSKIKEQSNFDNYYSQNILPKYQKICDKYQQYFDSEDYTEEILNFWEPISKPKLIFVPDILESKIGFAVTKSQEYYSITGLHNAEGEKEDYNIKKGWSNSIHEFSHSFFKDALIERGYFEEHLELANKYFDTIKDTIPEKVLKTYNVGHAYFEDCFMRAAKIFILEKYNQRKNKVNERSVEESLKIQIEEYGFKHVGVFYEELVKNSKKSVIDVYITTLKFLNSGS